MLTEQSLSATVGTFLFVDTTRRGMLDFGIRLLGGLGRDRGRLVANLDSGTECLRESARRCQAKPQQQLGVYLEPALTSDCID